MSGAYLVMRLYFLDNWPALLFLLFTASMLTCMFHAWLDGGELMDD